MSRTAGRVLKRVSGSKGRLRRSNAGGNGFCRRDDAIPERWRCINPTCGQVLDAAMTLGYRPPPGASKDFRELAEEFRTALHPFEGIEPRVRPSWPEDAWRFEKSGVDDGE